MAAPPLTGVAPSSPIGRASPRGRPVAPLSSITGAPPVVAPCPEPPAENADWALAYDKCPRWSPEWALTQTGNVWPLGFQVHGDRLYLDGQLCIPTDFTTPVVLDLHTATGHFGGDCLIGEVDRRYDFGDGLAMKRAVEEVIKRCGVCQATEHPHHSMKTPLRPTPIPPRLMDSVALDVFYMDHARHQGAEFDCLVLAVDRHSGWMVASPQLRKGMTARKVALDMLDRAWGPFGVPSVVTSDRGPQFAGAWWMTLCAGLGVRVSHALAYHHRSNGRAEVAGRQLRVLLRKLHADERGLNWVEALPPALRFIHDRKGEAGSSPYEIMF